jgi:peroxiredoxin
VKRAVPRALAFGLVAIGVLTALPARAEEEAPLSAGAYIRSVGKLKVGDPVPSFRAKDIYGKEVCLEDLIRSGRKPVLAFWSMFCLACVQKFNAMVTVQGRLADRGIAVISVNTDGEYRKGEQTVRDFIADFEKRNGVKTNFPVLYDERNWLPQALNIEFLPTIVTVGPQGRVAGIYQQFQEKAEADIIAGIENLALDLLRLYPTAAPAEGSGAVPCPTGK